MTEADFLAVAAAVTQSKLSYEAPKSTRLTIQIGFRRNTGGSPPSQQNARTITMDSRTIFVVFWLAVLEIFAWLFSLAGNFYIHFWDSRCKCLSFGSLLVSALAHTTLRLLDIQH